MVKKEQTIPSDGIHKQNVQRLDIRENSNPISIALRNLVKNDENLLQQRDFLIQNNLVKGNRKELNAYKASLPNQLTREQLLWSVGLVLSDATLQRNSSLEVETFRLKIQQQEFNRSLLEFTLELLKPWVMTISSIPNRKMMELDTIQHQAFNQLAEIFQDPSQTLSPKQCVQRVIPPNIGEYLEPIAIGSQFCGDGGRRDYGKNEGKAIQFHTQGFTKPCIETLAEALSDKYGWDARAKLNYTDKGRDFYLLQIEANSFESFMEIVQPYILPNFRKRLPKERSPNSRFGPKSGNTES